MTVRRAGLSRRRLLEEGRGRGGRRRRACRRRRCARAGEPGARHPAPAVVTGRTFRAWVSRGTGPGRTTLQDVKLRPVTGRMVVVRTEATNLCYSNVGVVLGHPGGASERRRRARQRGRRRRHAGGHRQHGAHPGPRRHRRRGSGRPRGAARAGGRSRLRVGHAAVRLVLPLPARARRHLPAARAQPRVGPDSGRGSARRHAGLLQLAHRRPRAS